MGCRVLASAVKRWISGADSTECSHLWNQKRGATVRLPVGSECTALAGWRDSAVRGQRPLGAGHTDPGLLLHPWPGSWGTGLGPNPSPSSFFGRRLRVRTPPAVSLLGACSPQARRLGGTGERGHGLEPTLDHACWDARDFGMLMGSEGYLRDGIGRRKWGEDGVGARA